MNVLLVNFHSRLNAGDAALLEESVSQINRVFNFPHIIISANWPFDPVELKGEIEVIGSPYYLCGTGAKKPIWKQISLAIYGTLLGWLVAVRLIKLTNRTIPEGWRLLLSAYFKANWVAAVPGNQFLSTGRFGWPFPLIALAVQLAYWFHKPFYVLPQSIGPLKRKWERVILHQLYSKARLVLLRDNQSLKFAKQIHLPQEKVRFIADPAFAFPASDCVRAASLLKEYGFVKGQDHLGITVISRMGYSLDQDKVSQYYSNLARALTGFIKKTKVHLFFFNQVIGPTSIEDDRRASEIVSRLLQVDNTQVSIVDRALPPAMLKACYGCMDLFIASRLHSGIFAISMGVPTIFIGYLYKTRGLLESLGLDAWVIDLGDESADVLQKKIEMGWNERKQYSNQLGSIIPGLIEMAGSIPEIIKADYEETYPED